jgi:hypothetical protein
MYKMPPRHYGCDKFIVGIVAVIILCFVALWYWGARADTAPKHALHAEPPTAKHSMPTATRH